MWRLDYAWRLFGTGLSFSLFGIGGLLLRLSVFPVLNLVVRDPETRRHRAQWIIHQTFRAFIGLMRGLGVLDYRITGAERLRQPGQLVIANHPSLIDVVFLISLMPRVDCVVNHQLWRNPFTGGPVRAAGYISNSGGEALVDDCAAALNAGRSLIIFPEGTRTVPGRPLKFQRGAANIALRAQRRFTPVLITCEPTTLTKGSKWYRIPRRRPFFRLTVLADIAVDDICHDNGPLAARRVTEHLQSFFTEELSRHEQSGAGDQAVDYRHA